ncbi:hypothetical protein G5B97_00825 [Campylobacter concisus]|nr:hypothetical protein [Campylobacter concisus]QPH98712.1 hypothetical protein G5B98_00615 [Campylobacter concisus]QPI00505.1 hypothetical protein G5B97_00825 [Campylobacter concisus]
MIGKIWMWLKFSKFWSLLAGIYPLCYRSYGCCAENISCELTKILVLA